MQMNQMWLELKYIPTKPPQTLALKIPAQGATQLAPYPLFSWLFPFISALIMLFNFTPCFIQLLWLQITTIAKFTTTQVMVHYQALNLPPQMTGSSKLLMTPLPYKIKQGEMLGGHAGQRLQSIITRQFFPILARGRIHSPARLPTLYLPLFGRCLQAPWLIYLKDDP